MINFNKKIKQIKQQGLYRTIAVNKSNLINFCSNDYLSLKDNPNIIKEFKKAIDKYGVGSGASHLVSGHSIAHQELELYLADYTKQEKALIFSNGYMANLGIFSALKDDLDWVLQDKLNHASLIDANFLIQQKIQRYKHNNILDLKNKLKKQTGFGLIATDNIFSMDGDIANINEINHLIKDKKNIFMQDDAHGFGIYTPNIPKNSIYMATFGKAIGTYGAFVSGNTDFIDYLIQKSRPYMYTTAIPAAIASATIKSLDIIQTGEMQEKLFTNIALFKSMIKTNSKTAIQPIIINDNNKALKISNFLYNKGFLVKAIRPPTVKKAILRITINAGHTTKQINNLVNLLNEKINDKL